ncbi:MAG: hypothetical protein MRJ65_12235 [Candidatus Brocadiaceae bacterium]|nr:hypothetical protein [Candidatus Brocadiaceae bacterium]
MNIQKGLLSIIGAVGGSGAIIVGLSIWLGNFLASSIDARLASSLEVNRHQQIRSSDARFGLYNELWTQLMDLKSAGDRLWENASQDNLESFIALLEKARLAVNRGRLILKEAHYQDLQNVFQAFENYQIGKGRLLKDLRYSDDVKEAYENFGKKMIGDQIRENKKSKQDYEALTVEILNEFRQQLELSP